MVLAEKCKVSEWQNHYQCPKCGQNTNWNLDLLRRQCCSASRRQIFLSAYRIVWRKTKIQPKKATVLKPPIFLHDFQLKHLGSLQASAAALEIMFTVIDF